MSIVISRKFLLVMKVIAIHLGKNPNKGGRPPKDIKLIENSTLLIGLVLRVEKFEVDILLVNDRSIIMIVLIIT